MLCDVGGLPLVWVGCPCVPCRWWVFRWQVWFELLIGLLNGDEVVILVFFELLLAGVFGGVFGIGPRLPMRGIVVGQWWSFV